MILISAAEPYDYLSTIAADYDYTLTLVPHGQVVEESYKNQVVHIADDSTEERITLSTGAIFYVEFPVEMLSESECGTLLDLYHTAAYANGMGRTFRWTSYDGHTYVVRFDSKLPRTIGPGMLYGLGAIRFRLLGRIADA